MTLKNGKAPYNLGFPKDWGVERFLIPIAFAPQIPYKGVEDIRHPQTISHNPLIFPPKLKKKYAIPTNFSLVALYDFALFGENV